MCQEDNINSNVVDLLMTYGLLKSTIEIFSEAVEPCIKELCENLDKLLMTEEKQKV